ncbi:bifunctional hydroxymethylpyrimidine kinase/phosphomethylpyrimidine kinase [Euzebya tangerina]|uniref:bifunctional hydroxymethylpyrimidine kinase/phosphomethylpyrimidine kinase n=1 Tax=Euzebya tangerina TaxID=591198 RepID=UPI000E32243B|nr:bifunctional hydroxymethylpyrimidine kinase/phosphomethylpyrimidine kinase [Euzebya tangerina]
MPDQQSPPVALTIAGSDSGGGAGIQADLKTFQELDVFGTSVIVALTAQNTVGVHGVHAVPPTFVTAQLDAVATDIRPAATKTGMLASSQLIRVVTEGIRRHELDNVVVDPVAVSKHGDSLLAPEATQTLVSELLPLATVVTPNLGEVELLTGVTVTGIADLPRAAEAVLALGPSWVLVKGGHLPDNDDAVDLLAGGGQTIEVRSTRCDSTDTHGTGCTLSSAIAANLAKGMNVPTAVNEAKTYITGAIQRGIRLGAGIGPVDHGWRRR